MSWATVLQSWSSTSAFLVSLLMQSIDAVKPSQSWPSFSCPSLLLVHLSVVFGHSIHIRLFTNHPSDNFLCAPPSSDHASSFTELSPPLQLTWSLSCSHTPSIINCKPTQTTPPTNCQRVHIITCNTNGANVCTHMGMPHEVCLIRCFAV